MVIQYKLFLPGRGKCIEAEIVEKIKLIDLESTVKICVNDFLSMGILWTIQMYY